MNIVMFAWVMDGGSLSHSASGGMQFSSSSATLRR